MAFYRCPYILRTREVCNRGCFDPKGCQIHQNSPSYVPCIECGKRTYSGYGFCDLHARKHCKREQYQWKKLVTELVTETIDSLGILGWKKPFLISVTSVISVTRKIWSFLTFFYFFYSIHTSHIYHTFIILYPI